MTGNIYTAQNYTENTFLVPPFHLILLIFRIRSFSYRSLDVSFMRQWKLKDLKHFEGFLHFCYDWEDTWKDTELQSKVPKIQMGILFDLIQNPHPSLQSLQIPHTAQVHFSPVTFQHEQALFVRRVRLGIVWRAEAAAICASHPVSTVTRPIWPLRWFNPVCCRCRHHLSI